MTPKRKTITVRLFTSIRALAGIRETKLEAQNVKEVIDILSKRYSSKIGEMLLETDGSLKRHFHVLVNGRHVRLLEGLATQLNDGDIIAIFPPIGGG